MFAAMDMLAFEIGLHGPAPERPSPEDTAFDAWRSEKDSTYGSHLYSIEEDIGTQDFWPYEVRTLMNVLWIEMGLYDTFMMGLPSPSDLQEEDATDQSAKAIQAKYGLTDEDLAARTPCLYFIIDSAVTDDPAWQVVWIETQPKESLPMNYTVLLDAASGEALVVASSNDGVG